MSGRLDFLAGAGAGAIFGMAGWAIAGGAKAWGEGEDAGAGVAEVCPKVSCAAAENWRVYSPGAPGCGATGSGAGIENPRVAPSADGCKGGVAACGVGGCGWLAGGPGVAAGDPTANPPLIPPPAGE